MGELCSPAKNYRKTSIFWRTQFAPTGVRRTMFRGRGRRPRRPVCNTTFDLLQRRCGCTLYAFPCGTKGAQLVALTTKWWMSSPMGNLLYIRNYSSVSLTAATFLDKGRHTKCNRTVSETNQTLFLKRTVEDACPYNGTTRLTAHTRRGEHSLPVQTIIANGIWGTKRAMRSNQAFPCQGRGTAPAVDE